MKIKYLSIIVLFIQYNVNVSGCNINMDSLFNYHLSSMDQHLKSIIDGYILPTGNADNKILADISGKPIETNYNDSTKFFIYGNNADFLKMYEFINDFEWERDISLPSIKISRKDILMIKNWYEVNKERINCDKIEKVLYWIRNHYMIYMEKSTDSYSFE